MEPAEASGAHERLYMDAVIWPNRSLSRRGLYVLLGFFAIYNTVVAMFLLFVGAFPVPVFLGIDFLAVVIAFHVSNRRARDAERVKVSADTVQVSRDERGRTATVWTSPTAFTHVAMAADDEDRPEVQIRLSGRSLVVGQALSPKERADFARALERAIRCAREERYSPAVAPA